MANSHMPVAHVTTDNGRMACTRCGYRVEHINAQSLLVFLSLAVCHKDKAWRLECSTGSKPHKCFPAAVYRQPAAAAIMM
eukprot:1140654-Pelagomonas_calceolata.AAC.2